MPNPYGSGGLDGHQLQELAVFVRAHSGKGAGILWPEHAAPQDWRGRPDGLAAGLALLLDRPVAAASCAAVPFPNPDDVLVFQLRGSSGWQLTPPGTRAEASPRKLRLRTGEALFVPRGYFAQSEQTDSSRRLCLVVGAARTA
ncbi:hypothetical protein ACIP93_35215 [Streptomyces sp. NPDC088745]|uniref:hypothetical protein n=1 Tax=Streptomyces sp. NPDC088745 TaxID=3365884 RepID=UPI00382D21F9